MPETTEGHESADFVSRFVVGTDDEPGLPCALFKNEGDDDCAVFAELDGIMVIFLESITLIYDCDGFLMIYFL